MNRFSIVFASLRRLIDCFPSQRWQTASSHQRNQPKGSRWMPCRWSSQDWQHEIGIEGLERVVAADLAHNVAGPAQFVAQENLHLAAHLSHLSLGHAEEEVLLRPRPGLAVLVGEAEPGCVGAVGAAAVQERALEDADV